tara:strand:- start:959 stop:1300 length:342 start_codon:yes stop_codon:yes gene_type:complete
MSMSDYNIEYMLGYLDHAQIVDGVIDGEVVVEEMKYHIERMQDRWGSYEGVLDFLRLYSEDRTLGIKFKETMMETSHNNYDTFKILCEFDEEYTEEQWRKEIQSGDSDVDSDQ